MSEGLVINTNTAASTSVAGLASTNAKLQQSLMRLSSGYKINRPSDDAGGLAVSMKMEAAMKRNVAAQNNIGNAVSFLQTQDGALSTVVKVLERVSELKLLSTDVTKSSSDVANYNTEFSQLKSQLTNLQGEKFNGVSMFSNSDSTTIDVTTSDDGTQTVSITKSNVNGSISTITGASTLGDIATVAVTTTALQGLATLRAQNGAETNRLLFAAEMLTTNKINLEAANSRIKDTDVAQESTQFAKFNILMQSGSAMLVQANAVPQVALRLLT